MCVDKNCNEFIFLTCCWFGLEVPSHVFFKVSKVDKEIEGEA